MNLSDLQSKIDELNFNEIVKQESREYLIEIEKESNTWGKDYRKLFLIGLKKFHKSDDKLIYLFEALNYFKKEIDEYDFLLKEYIDRGGNNENVPTNYWEIIERQDYNKWHEKKKLFEAQIFYVVRDLEKLGIKNLDADAFNSNEVSNLERKINAILIKLDELSAGQEVIFNSVDELKTDFTELKSEFPLGKKRWYQRATGMVVNFAGEKSTEEIYNALRPLIKDFFNTHAPHLLENL